MMRIGSMITDVARSLFKKPFTERYPFVVKPAPERARGKLEWVMSKCTACMACVRDCPADAIKVKIVDKAAKKFLFAYRIDRCIYCAQCVASCPTEALSMSREDWHTASGDRAPYSVVYGGEPVPTGPAALPDPAPGGASPSSSQAPER
jgi:formate hydrogenlyase subunit 6/NADH:ubiquinone oxidoreductase subunit I